MSFLSYFLFLFVPLSPFVSSLFLRESEREELSNTHKKTTHDSLLEACLERARGGEQEGSGERGVCCFLGRSFFFRSRKLKIATTRKQEESAIFFSLSFSL